MNRHLRLLLRAHAHHAARRSVVVLLVLAALSAPRPAASQHVSPPPAGPDSAARQAARVTDHTAPIAAGRIPFGVGEQARYRVSYNVVGRVGTGTMEIVGIDTVRGSPAYHAVFTLRGRFLLAQVNNRFESWLDVRRVFSHRFEQQTHEVNFRRDRTREFLTSQRRWTGQTNGREESGELTTSEPLDDTSFLYFVRTQDLQVGYEYTYDRYWNPEGNPVRVQALRRQTVRVPAGTFETIVLQPIIRTSGMFSEGGEAEVYYSVTGARQLVMLRARLSIGTLQLQLESFEPGSSD
jgi:hypothetical protein